jgi:hypothetical protein
MKGTLPTFLEFGWLRVSDMRRMEVPNTGSR